MKSTFLSLAILLTLSLLGTGCAADPKSYSSPEQAASAVVNAARVHDHKTLEYIFGDEAKEILSSGDEVADHNAADKFVEAYDQKHNLTGNEDGSVTLNVGDNDWPLPIPLVMDGKGGWRFDTAAGREEILNRRIGRNELSVINVCGAVVDAQREYTLADHNGDGLPEYALKFISDPGQHNGLYWPTAEGEPPSPLGPLVGIAVAEGYSQARGPTGEPLPYHGYFYRMLTAQGTNATGGAHDYIVDGKMIGGFALVAFPATYGNSGIMTFITNHDGTIYQRDLGGETPKIAKAMTAFDPGPGWEKVEVPPVEAK